MINPKLWLDVLTKPKETFKKARKLAKTDAILVQMIVAFVAAGFIEAAGSIFLQTPSAPTTAEGFGYIIGRGIISGLVIWFIINGFLYLVAKGFGGKGDIKTQLWLSSLFDAPLAIVTSLIMLIPFVGIFAVVIIGLYALYLVYLMLLETHRYSTNRAVVTILIYLVVGVIVLTIGSLLYGTYLLPQSGSVI